MLQLPTLPVDDLEAPLDLETAALLTTDCSLPKLRIDLDTLFLPEILYLVLEFLSEADILVWAEHPQGIELLRKYFIFDSLKLISCIELKKILKDTETQSVYLGNKRKNKLKIVFSTLGLAVSGAIGFSVYSFSSTAHKSNTLYNEATAQANHFLAETQLHCSNIFSYANSCMILPFSVGPNIVCEPSSCDEMMERFFINCAQIENLMNREDFSRWPYRYSFERENGLCAQSIFDRMPVCSSKTFSTYLNLCTNRDSVTYVGFTLAAVFIMVLELAVIAILFACYESKKHFNFMNKPAHLLAIKSGFNSQKIFKNIITENPSITIQELKDILLNTTDNKNLLLSGKQSFFKLRSLREAREEKHVKPTPF